MAANLYVAKSMKKFVRHFTDKGTSNLINTFEAYLEEHLDDDWDEGFDYGDDEEQETSK